MDSLAARRRGATDLGAGHARLGRGAGARNAADKTSRGGASHEKAIRTLAATTEGALALAARMHAGALDAADVKQAVAIGAKAPGADIRGLFEDFLPESQRRATLGAKIDPQTILSRQGDRARGKLIFYSDGARCRACHDIEDRGKSLGPTLKEINKKYPRPAEMLQHVLQPSLKIDEPFAAYAVVTDDGRVFIGLLVKQDKTEITIQTMEKKLVRIARDDIDEMARVPSR